MPQALDEPLRVVPLDELGDERARLLKALERMEGHALLLERAHESFGDPVALGLPDVGRRDGHRYGSQTGAQRDRGRCTLQLARSS